MYQNAPAASVVVLLRAPVGPRPLEGLPVCLEVPFIGRSRAHLFVLGAPVGPRPLEDLEVPVLSSTRARLRVPGAPVGPRPLEHGQVAALCSICTEVVSELLTAAGRRR